PWRRRRSGGGRSPPTARTRTRRPRRPSPTSATARRSSTTASTWRRHEPPPPPPRLHRARLPRDDRVERALRPLRRRPLPVRRSQDRRVRVARPAALRPHHHGHQLRDARADAEGAGADPVLFALSAARRADRLPRRLVAADRAAAAARVSELAPRQRRRDDDDRLRSRRRRLDLHHHSGGAAGPYPQRRGRPAEAGPAAADDRLDGGAAALEK